MVLFEVKGWNISTDKVCLGGTEEKKKKKKSKLRKSKKQQSPNANEIESLPKKRKENDGHEQSKKKAKKQYNSSERKEHESQGNELDHEPLIEDPAPMPVLTSKLTPLQQKMMAKLSGSRFRWINEQLYTLSSEKALSLVKSQPELFDEYHQGFKSQVQLWPLNPVDVFVDQVKSRTARPIRAPGGLPGHSNKQVVIADMGCGEAQFAKEISEFVKQYNSCKKSSKKNHTSGPGAPSSLNIKVYSFDLKKANDRITVADVKSVPLSDESCNIVIFCLALMGTNFLDFIQEAYRILAPNGELWIAEIKSRFSESNRVNSKSQRPEDPGQEFVNSLKLFGFLHKKTDNDNKMFSRFEFFKPSREIMEQQKNSRKKKRFIEQESKMEELELKRQRDAEGHWLLKPCIYKRR